MGRSKEFKILSCGRPWYRSFHFAWLSFFLAFTGWFAIVPALEYLVEDESNDITKDERLTSNIISVLGTIFIRLALGPMLEKWGPRRIQSVLLTYGAICVMLSSLVNTAAGLYAVRFAISFVGGAFVPCQFWAHMMFSGELSGISAATAGGWGNLGAGFTSIFVASLIEGFQNIADDDTAWRYAMIIPGLMMLSVSVPMWFLSDDCPQGHWDKRLYGREQPGKGDKAKAAIAMEEAEASTSAKRLSSGSGSDIEATKHKSITDTWGPWWDWRVGILFLQYAACFGVELAINNSMTTYLYQNFTEDTPECEDPFTASDKFIPECSILGKNKAAMVAGLFGLMNLFARALGGFASDKMNNRYHMRGRLGVQALVLAGEGVMLIVFSRQTDLTAAIVCLILFSVFVQSSEGSTYALVPHVNPLNIGAVAGIVGAGGNAGAVCWSTMFKAIDSTSDAYMYLGCIVLGCAALTIPLSVNGTALFWGENEKMLFGTDADGVSDAGSNDTEDTGSFHHQTATQGISTV